MDALQPQQTQTTPEITTTSEIYQNVSLEAARPQASIWGNIAKTIFPRVLRRGFNNLMRSLSSAPYYQIDLNSPNGNPQRFNNQLQELGIYLSAGTDKYGLHTTRYSDGLDAYVMETFTAPGRTAQDLIDLAYTLEEKQAEIVEELKKILDQESSEWGIVVESKQEARAILSRKKALCAQLAGVNALIRSYENLVAQQILGDIPEHAILEAIPKKQLEALCEEKRQEHARAIPKPTVSTAMGTQFHMTTADERYAAPVELRGADYLRVLPRKQIVGLLLNLNHHNKALALAELLPYKTEAEYKKQAKVFAEIQKADPMDAIQESAQKEANALDLKAIANLEGNTLVKELFLLHQWGILVPRVNEHEANMKFEYQSMEKQELQEVLATLKEKKEAIDQKVKEELGTFNYGKIYSKASRAQQAAGVLIQRIEHDLAKL